MDRSAAPTPADSTNNGEVNQPIASTSSSSSIRRRSHESAVKRPRSDHSALVTTDDEDADDPGTMGEPAAPGMRRIKNERDTGEDEQHSSGDPYKFVDAKPYRTSLQKIRSEMFVEFTKSDLEELIVQKICESITERAVTGELKRRTEVLESELVSWKSRALACEKQVKELKEILEKCLRDLEEKASEFPTPLRVNRSVGMQVNINPCLPKAPPKRPNTSTKGTFVVDRIVERASTSKKAPAKTPTPEKRSLLLSKPACAIPPFNSTRSSNNTALNGSQVMTVVDASFHVSSPSVKTDSGSVIDLTDDIPEGKPTAPVPKPTTTVAPMVRKPVTPTSLEIMGIRCPLLPADIVPPDGNQPSWKPVPPQPILKISLSDIDDQGILASWFVANIDQYEEIKKFQLYAYYATTDPIETASWRLVGELTPLTLPMACNLSRFNRGHRYFFIVRAVDIRNRSGPFSHPGSIYLCG